MAAIWRGPRLPSALSICGFRDFRSLAQGQRRPLLGPSINPRLLSPARIHARPRSPPATSASDPTESAHASARKSARNRDAGAATCFALHNSSGGVRARPAGRVRRAARVCVRVIRKNWFQVARENFGPEESTRQVRDVPGPRPGPDRFSARRRPLALYLFPLQSGPVRGWRRRLTGVEPV